MWVLPASAGMSPESIAVDAAEKGAPRVSGDEPPPPPTPRAGEGVLPASAGMSPPHQTVRGRGLGAPRVSGDEPYGLPDVSWRNECFPRQRG